MMIQEESLDQSQEEDQMTGEGQNLEEDLRIGTEEDCKGAHKEDHKIDIKGYQSQEEERTNTLTV